MEKELFIINKIKHLIDNEINRQFSLNRSVYYHNKEYIVVDIIYLNKCHYIVYAIVDKDGSIKDNTFYKTPIDNLDFEFLHELDKEIGSKLRANVYHILNECNIWRI